VARVGQMPRPGRLLFSDIRSRHRPSDYQTHWAATAGPRNCAPHS